jgi:hypothetical protein
VVVVICGVWHPVGADLGSTERSEAEIYLVSCRQNCRIRTPQHPPRTAPSRSQNAAETRPKRSQNAAPTRATTRHTRRPTARRGGAQRGPGAGPRGGASCTPPPLYITGKRAADRVIVMPRSENPVSPIARQLRASCAPRCAPCARRLARAAARSRVLSCRLGRAWCCPDRPRRIAPFRPRSVPRAPSIRPPSRPQSARADAPRSALICAPVADQGGSTGGAGCQGFRPPDRPATAGFGRGPISGGGTRLYIVCPTSPS